MFQCQCNIKYIPNKTAIYSMFQCQCNIKYTPNKTAIHSNVAVSV